MCVCVCVRTRTKKDRSPAEGPRQCQMLYLKKNQLTAGSNRARQIFFQYPRGLQHNPLS